MATVGGKSTVSTRATLDQESKQWVERLRAGHPRHDEALARLHDVLLRVAHHELSRRRTLLGSITRPRVRRSRSPGRRRRADERVGQARRVSRAQPLHHLGLQVRDVRGVGQGGAARLAPTAAQPSTSSHGSGCPTPWHLAPGDRLEQREQLEALSDAIGGLTDRQREVFVGDRAQRRADRRPRDPARDQPQRDLQEPVRREAQPAHVDGRRRSSRDRGGGDRMTDPRRLDELLRAKDGDAGCTAGEAILGRVRRAGARRRGSGACLSRHGDPSPELSRLSGRSRRASRSSPTVRGRQARVSGSLRITACADRTPYRRGRTAGASATN